MEVGEPENLVACNVTVIALANDKPQKQDSGSGASVQVGDYVLSIARAAVACDYVINTGKVLCTLPDIAYEHNASLRLRGFLQLPVVSMFRRASDADCTRGCCENNIKKL